MTLPSRCFSSVKGPTSAGEFDNLPPVDALLGGQNDPQAVDRRVHRLGQIEILLNRFQEEGLLAIAERLMAGLVLRRNEFVALDEILVGSDLGVVILDEIGLGVPIDVG